ncbi:MULTISPECIES: peptidylprolyl isomerase [unclassified Acinetobacter]|uniref:peptidylprolyl isomerase n=1 Tax=unclassified Acinetobacter TaxID=196816 RepID=UPI00293517E2|nr:MULTISPECIES: peptidylprolyl isomerase [unclassified Acinetobacter]WOE33030.1 peptidylprolyl isomerase [Acinetobacter sp. SAAs470]WOE38508.1 peptidylprolyl isomerase [Acinetobacter sp. SAAs474]
MKMAIVRHILVKDKTLAEQLRQKIKHGADFTKIAKQYSTCPSAKKGGELGEVKPKQLVASIDKAVFSLAEHELHGPIKSPFGWHLLEIKFRMDF